MHHLFSYDLGGSIPGMIVDDDEDHFNIWKTEKYLFCHPVDHFSDIVCLVVCRHYNNDFNHASFIDQLIKASKHSLRVEISKNSFFHNLKQRV
jgi:hypothetical protein